MTSEHPISRRLTRLYGMDPARTRGVLHAVAAWRAPDATLRVIRIGPESPASETDWLVLRCARMRADALITTGRILREEPDVQHTEHDEALLAWRRECVGRSEPPRSVVLTSGRDLDLDHPLLRTAHAPLVVTGREGAARLRREAQDRTPALEVVARDAPGIREAVALLRERGCETLLVEAGPTTAAELYREPVLVDELLLSVYEERALAEPLVGPELLEPGAIEVHFEPSREPARIDEPSGAWSFSRWLRRR